MYSSTIGKKYYVFQREMRFRSPHRNDRCAYWSKKVETGSHGATSRSILKGIRLNRVCHISLFALTCEATSQIGRMKVPPETRGSAAIPADIVGWEPVQLAQSGICDGEQSNGFRCSPICSFPADRHAPHKCCCQPDVKLTLHRPFSRISHTIHDAAIESIKSNYFG
jgi:hypothetical protein